MGTVNIEGATGQGYLSLGGYQNVNEVVAYASVFADRADVAGISPVRRVHHQCWYGIGLDPGGGLLDGIVITTFWRYLQMECETTFIPSINNIWADTLYWDIQPGGEMTFEVWWP